MSDTITLRIEIEDGGSIKKAKVNYDDLEKLIRRVKKTTDDLNSSMVNLASVTQAFQNISTAIGGLSNVFSDLTSSYEFQEAAEVRLAQMMRNTMGASDAEVESIKTLCSAQQELGVIGDEVQLAAAQELATYLEMSSSLETLIPLMNDMAVQQYGVGASAESVTQIAAMMGKVMQGQTEALGRNGYRFSEAQKQILKYGEETEKVAVLVDVCGSVVNGMNEQMANTPTGRLAQVRNTFGDIKEYLGSITIRLQNYIHLLSAAGQSITGIKQFSAVFREASKSLSGYLKHSAIAALSFRILNIRSIIASRGVDAARRAVNRLNIALATGIIGLVLTLGTVLFSLFNSSKKAKEGLEEVDEATQAYNDAVCSARGEIAKEIVDLEHLIKQHGDETKKIQELNAAYGESFGYHNTAKEWYDILINKSKEYCKMLGYEAKLKAAGEAYSKALVEQDEASDAVWNFNGWVQSGDDVNPEYQKLVDKRDAANKKVAEKEKIFNEAKAGYEKASGDFKESNKEKEKPIEEMSYSELGTAIQNKKTVLGNLSGVKGQEEAAQKVQSELKDMEARYKKLGKENGLSKDTFSGGSTKHEYGGDKLIAEAKSYNELSNNVKYYEKEMEKADASDKEQLANLAKGYAEAKKKVDDFNKSKEKIMLEAQKPEEIQSVGDIQSLEQVNKAIEYQQRLRNSASAEDLKNVDAEIKRLNDLKTAFEDSSHVELRTKEIQTYKQLEEEISFYSRQLKTASEADRKKIQEHIVELESLKKKWDDVLDEMSKPGDISTLNTIEELDEAISWYSNRQKKISGQEYVDIQKIINALQQKKKLMEAPASTETRIAEMQVETGQLGNLEGKSLKMKLELIGLDGVAQKIREIQQMMNDPSATEDQKKALKDLQDEYIGYYKQLLRTDKGLIQTWGSVKGLGNSIEGMTEAIKGQGNAWKKISGIIDSTISLYQSISQIIEIVKMLTGVTKAQTAAKQVEGAQDITTGTQAVTGAGMEVAASQSAAAAKRGETTANVGATASGLMAAHSSIPFVGFAIGAAMVAAMLALMFSLPKFADGAIAYGPTLGLFGEYSGASHNPEVVAPLDKLKGMLYEPAGLGGRVTFRIEGRNLVGVLGKESHYRSRR